MSQTTDLQLVNPVDYPSLGPEELVGALASVVSRLSSSLLELSAVKCQYITLYHRAYEGSFHEKSHAARDEAAQHATSEIKEDEIRLEGNIAALSVERDLLVTLLEHRAR